MYVSQFIPRKYILKDEREEIYSIQSMIETRERHFQKLKTASEVSYQTTEIRLIISTVLKNLSPLVSIPLQLCARLQKRFRHCSFLQEQNFWRKWQRKVAEFKNKGFKKQFGQFIERLTPPQFSVRSQLTQRPKRSLTCHLPQVKVRLGNELKY